MARVYRYVTPAGAGVKDGTTWAKAMGEAEFETSLEGSAVADYIYFIAGGTYTFNSSYDSSARDGTGLLPIAIIGVKAGTTNEGANIVYSDWARADGDRPFFDCGAYQFKIGDYYTIRNIYFQGSIANTVNAGVYCLFENCKFDQDVAVGTDAYVLLTGSYCAVINCKFTSAKGRGIFAGGYNRISYCYFNFPDTTYGIGINVTSVVTFVSNNIFNACYVGLYLNQTFYGHVIQNNTFYACIWATYGVSTGTDAPFSVVLMNNLYEASTGAAVCWDNQVDSNLHWGTHGDDARNVDMWSGVATTGLYSDYANTTGDPLFTAAGSDFRIAVGSPCYGVAQDLYLGIG